jgi:hypothetical protein
VVAEGVWVKVARESMSRETEEKSTALKAADKKQRYQKKKTTIVLFKCGKPGHMKSNCLEWENKKRTDAAALYVAP